MARSQATSFESLAAATGAKVIAAELFLKLLAVDDSHSAFDFRLGWEAPSSFTHRLITYWPESTDLRGVRVAWVCSFEK